MVPNSHFTQVIQYATFAVSTLREISTAFKNPILNSSVSLTDAVLVSLASTRSNKKKLVTLLEQIHTTLCLIVQLHTQFEVDGAIPPGLAHEIASFSKTLQKIYSFLDTQQGGGMVKQLFRQFDSAGQLKICEEELDNLLNRLRLLVGGGAMNSLTHAQRDARQQHEELVAFLKTHDLLSSCGTFSSTNTIFSLESSSLSMSMLPPSPKIFYGRDSELENLLIVLEGPSPRIAILGPAGIGKSSLALSVLHHARVSTGFPNLYFVSCRSMRTGEDIVLSVASYVGVDMGPNLLQRVVRHLCSGPPALLILDNFETPWEPMSSRAGVEEVVSFLSDVSQLAIIVTMRGAERPNRVKWTQPFLPPLRPLDNSAALQTFLDIAGDDQERTCVQQLLALTGNLPLAVSLIASAAVSESCESIIARWKTEATRVLSGGHDQTSSLDISIMFSFSSPRMTPEAQALLSILSLLPDGLSHAELLHINLPIANILHAKTTLLRTSLAYVSHTNRLVLLVPIREYIRAAHPPPYMLKATLRKYYRDLIDVSQAASSSAEVTQVLATLGNFYATLEDGLRDPAATNSDVISTLESTIQLDKVTHMGSCEISPLMPLVADSVTRFMGEPVYGAYLVNVFSTSLHRPVENPADAIAQASRYFKGVSSAEKAKWYYALAIYYSGQENYGHWRTTLAYFNKAVAHSPEPTALQLEVSVDIAILLSLDGRYVAARTLARKAQQMATVLGNLFLKAQACAVEARCGLWTGDFIRAADLCLSARTLIRACGLADSDTDSGYQNNAATILVQQTDYSAARSAFTRLVERCPASECTPINLLHLGIIDAMTGAPAAVARAHIDTARQQLLGRGDAVPWNWLPVYQRADAVVLLREGDTDAARRIFQSLVNTRMNHYVVTFALERLADLDSGMGNITTTHQWAIIYLASAISSQNRLVLLKSLRCMGQIAAAEEDNDTAMALFEVALGGFTDMDVYWWRADCMSRKADTLVARGELIHARELFLAARSLFVYCSTQHRVQHVNLQLRNIDMKL